MATQAGETTWLSDSGMAKVFVTAEAPSVHSSVQHTAGGGRVTVTESRRVETPSVSETQVVRSNAWTEDLPVSVTTNTYDTVRRADGTYSNSHWSESGKSLPSTFQHSGSSFNHQGGSINSQYPSGSTMSTMSGFQQQFPSSGYHSVTRKISGPMTRTTTPTSFYRPSQPSILTGQQNSQYTTQPMPYYQSGPMTTSSRVVYPTEGVMNTGTPIMETVNSQYVSNDMHTYRPTTAFVNENRSFVHPNSMMSGVRHGAIPSPGLMQAQQNAGVAMHPSSGVMQSADGMQSYGNMHTSGGMQTPVMHTGNYMPQNTSYTSPSYIPHYQGFQQQQMHNGVTYHSAHPTTTSVSPVRQPVVYSSQQSYSHPPQYLHPSTLSSRGGNNNYNLENTTTTPNSNNLINNINQQTAEESTTNNLPSTHNNSENN